MCSCTQASYEAPEYSEALYQYANYVEQVWVGGNVSLSRTSYVQDLETSSRKNSVLEVLSEHILVNQVLMIDLNRDYTIDRYMLYINIIY